MKSMKIALLTLIALCAVPAMGMDSEGDDFEQRQLGSSAGTGRQNEKDKEKEKKEIVVSPAMQQFVNIQKEIKKATGDNNAGVMPFVDLTPKEKSPEWYEKVLSPASWRSYSTYVLGITGFAAAFRLISKERNAGYSTQTLRNIKAMGTKAYWKSVLGWVDTNIIGRMGSKAGVKVEDGKLVVGTSRKPEGVLGNTMAYLAIGGEAAGKIALPLYAIAKFAKAQGDKAYKKAKKAVSKKKNAESNSEPRGNNREREQG